MSRSAETRLGLVGCGRLAERGYLPALKRIGSARLVAVADPVLERCRTLAPDVQPHESAAELIAAGGVDAMVIASPGAAHAADARLAAEAGLAALVEKPPAADAEEAAAMAALDPAPWMGFNRRYERGIERLRERVPLRRKRPVAYAPRLEDRGRNREPRDRRRPERIPPPGSDA